MSAKHTPGPWTCNNHVGVVFGPDCQVAFCGDFNDPELIPYNADRWNADARLIAAAPDLLEALEECAADLEAEIEARRGAVLERTMVRDLATLAKARAAIAKAKGETV